MGNKKVRFDIVSKPDFKYGDEETRTPYSQIANLMLYQMSYIP